jgi:hypothetical protein
VIRKIVTVYSAINTLVGIFMELFDTEAGVTCMSLSCKELKGEL